MHSSNTLTRWAARLALLALAGCVDPYLPNVADSPSKLLVVDGFINGNGTSTFLLSRSVSVGTSGTAAVPPAEKGAQVTILDDQGQSYGLREAVAGTYRSDSLVLDAARQYHLRIITATKAAYESDAVPLKLTPAIDQVHYRLTGDNVQILLDTHSPDQQGQYYRWAVSETWQFNSAYESKLQYRHGRMMERTTPNYTCWRTEDSRLIRQASTTQLGRDALTDQLLIEPLSHDERFKIRYSVLVTQVAETADEFAYYDILRKNTEAVGTVNDPLPSQLTGNVHRTSGNTSEPVLGFVSAHTVQRQRIFIARADLQFPNNWKFNTPYLDCEAGIELFFDPQTHKPILHWPHTRTFVDTLISVPIDLKIDNDTVGYTGSSYLCVDCRARGSNIKPSFW